MDAEERTNIAIKATREILMDVLDDPCAILAMTLDCIKPEDVENQVVMILEYMDRTMPKEEASDE
ncbi:MAG: hypothetical protein KAX80_09175 [Planctomycetes bacterium]|nr:hypothetical protein [Planctomycetota bacterium]